MKKSSPERSLYLFHENMNWNIDLLIKIQLARRVIRSIQEKRSIFQAFVLSICAEWEVLVENLLIDCLNRDTSRYAEYTGFKLPKHITRETCKAVIMGTGYLDFKSVSQLKDISKKILVVQCNPFIHIPTSRGRKIDEFFTIRNYLAHYSEAARRSLLHVYRTQYNLSTFVEPGVFLLAEDKREKIPRMGVYINNFKKTSIIMAESLGIEYS
jgi:hypothetical protein